MADLADQGQVALLPIVLEPSENHAFPLARHMWINFDQEHFYVRFYQVVPPLVVDDQSIPTSIRAKLISAMAVPAAAFPAFAKAMQESIEKYESATGISLRKAGDDDGNDGVNDDGDE